VEQQWSARSSAARQRILAAAAEELVATGDVEVAAVARRAGVSVGLPYRAHVAAELWAFIAGAATTAERA
jgi:mannose-6-phosphate isomerase-like protein (cupin superfamily)